MNEMEEQLSRLFNTAAGEPPNRVTVRAVRRQVIRRRIITCAAATAACIVAGTAGLAVSASAGGTGPAVNARHPVVPPRFYIETTSGQGQQPPDTFVRSTATGAGTGTVSCPWPRSQLGGLGASSHEIFMTCLRYVKQGQGYRVTGSRIFEFRLTRSGRAGRYFLVHGGTFNGEGLGGISASADGSEIAVSVTSSMTGKSRVDVISTRTGARAAWLPGLLPGGARFAGGDLSLTGDGRELAVFGTARCPRQAAHCKSPGEAMITVSPASAGGSFASGRQVFKQAQITSLRNGFVNNAWISPDGSSATAAVVSGGITNGSVSVVRISARTGMRQRTLFNLNTGNGFFYRFVTADPSGQFILFNAGPTTGTVFGWVDHGKLISLKPAGTNVFGATWN